MHSMNFISEKKEGLDSQQSYGCDWIHGGNDCTHVWLEAM